MIRWCGASLWGAAACLVVFVIAVFIPGQSLPVPPQELLQNPFAPTALFVLAAFGELLLLPAGLGLYLTMKDVDRTPMVFAASLWCVSSPLFLVSRGPLIALSQLSSRYLAAGVRPGADPTLVGFLEPSARGSRILSKLAK